MLGRGLSYTSYMADVETVLRSALKLDREDRERLVAEIRGSLDRDWETAWAAELGERSRAAREHPEALVDWEDVESELFGEPPTR